MSLLTSMTKRLKRIFLNLTLVVSSPFVFSQTLVEVDKIMPSDSSYAGQFGLNLSLNDPYLFVCDRKAKKPIQGQASLSGAGTVHILQKNNSGQWKETQKLYNPYPIQNAEFGSSISVYGQWMAIGSESYYFGGVGGVGGFQGVGSIAIFQEDPIGSWTAIDTLMPDSIYRHTYFGRVIAINDGFLASNIDEQNPYSLKVFYKDIYDNWKPFQKLTLWHKHARVNSLLFDGIRLYVGTVDYPWDAAGQDSLVRAGAVHVFELDLNNSWNQIGLITSPHRQQYGSFGHSIHLSDDYLWVGAFGEETDLANQNPVLRSGAVYAFRETNPGEWTTVTKIISPEREQEEQFGVKVVTNSDASLVYISSEDREIDSSQQLQVDLGAVYKYVLNGTESWQFTQKLVPSDRWVTKRFGLDIVLDGNDVLVGSDESPHPDLPWHWQYPGAVYHFSQYALGSELSDDFESEITLIPNPTAGKVMLRFNAIDILPAEVHVYKGDGSLSSQYHVFNSIQSIELPQESGLYYINIVSNFKSIRTFKVVRLP